MADVINLTVTQDTTAPFILTQSQNPVFTLSTNTSGPIQIQLGPSLNGLVDLTGPSSLKGFELFAAGTLNANEIILANVAPYAFTLNPSNCSAVALEAATSTSVFVLKKTVANVTTDLAFITFNAGDTLGTFSFFDYVVNKGDLITLSVTGAPDATLADIAFLLAE